MHGFSPEIRVQSKTTTKCKIDINFVADVFSVMNRTDPQESNQLIFITTA